MYIYQNHFASVDWAVSRLTIVYQVLSAVASVAGCPEAALANIYSAAQSAVNHNALGMIVSHWSGLSHVTHFSLIWPAIVAAAGLAWNASVEKVIFIVCLFFNNCLCFCFRSVYVH